MPFSQVRVINWTALHLAHNVWLCREHTGQPELAWVELQQDPNGFDQLTPTYEHFSHFFALKARLTEGKGFVCSSFPCGSLRHQQD